ncbi:hypothetical protein EDB83DRAFT_393906 [Lactarius deliciosus]|nr:hypothetical protein EDB83DRAFT_393906 [Lactarius deliciosus]
MRAQWSLTRGSVSFTGSRVVNAAHLHGITKEGGMISVQALGRGDKEREDSCAATASVAIASKGIVAFPDTTHKRGILVESVYVVRTSPNRSAVRGVSGLEYIDIAHTYTRVAHIIIIITSIPNYYSPRRAELHRLWALRCPAPPSFAIASRSFICVLFFVGHRPLQVVIICRHGPSSSHCGPSSHSFVVITRDRRPSPIMDHRPVIVDHCPTLLSSLVTVVRAPFCTVCAIGPSSHFCRRHS